jgi:hypothetical protein
VAISSGQTRLEVFALGTDRAIWRRAWDGAWLPGNSWQGIGGTFTE